MLGVFDSGIGGLTVVKKVFEILPEYQILYFGDTARTPYGGRGKRIIKQYAAEGINFLINQGAKIIIIACNTVSAVAYNDLKERFSLPIFEVVRPAIEKAVRTTQNKKIGVIGTRATINSKIYEKLIKEVDSKIQIFSQACPLLVPLVEEGWFKKIETKMILKKYLQPLRVQQIDTLILACTHYPFLRNLIQVKIGRQVKSIDPGEETVLKIKNFLNQNPEIEKSLIKGEKHKFFVSDLTPGINQITREWLGRKIEIEEVKV